MKKIIIIVAALFMTDGIAIAQEKKPGKEHKEAVPQAVLDSFAVKHPDINDARWEKEGKHWEAETKRGRKEFKIIFDAMGNFLYTETHIEVSELPKEIMEFMAANYPHGKITDAGKIVDVNGIIMYEVEIKGTAHLFFNEKGEFLNRED